MYPPYQGKRIAAATTRAPIHLPQNLLYLNIGVPIKPVNLQDIQNTVDYIPDEYKDNYADIISNSINGHYFEDVVFNTSMYFFYLKIYQK